LPEGLLNAALEIVASIDINLPEVIRFNQHRQCTFNEGFMLREAHRRDKPDTVSFTAAYQASLVYKHKLRCNPNMSL